MIFNAKNASLPLEKSRMDYICFGSGEKNLIILPGLGDGLRTVKGTALPMALLYRMFGKHYRVYAFSRKEPLCTGYTTAHMARDLAEAMDMLDIGQADVWGVSMGGMIAQHLAADYPEKVKKLVLTVTSPCSNPILEESIGEWVDLAEKGNHTGFMDSNLRRIYSEEYYRRNKWTVPILGRITKPASYDRFLILAEACRTHDAMEKLSRIQAQTLVIGGEKDLALGVDGSRLLADGIPAARLWIYSQWGHGLYEEAKDFNQRVLDFLEEVTE